MEGFYCNSLQLWGSTIHSCALITVGLSRFSQPTPILTFLAFTWLTALSSVMSYFLLFSLELVLTLCSFCTLFWCIPFVIFIFYIFFVVSVNFSGDLSCLLPLLFSPRPRWVGPDCDWSPVARCLGMFPFLCVCACVGGCVYVMCEAVCIAMCLAES